MREVRKSIMKDHCLTRKFDQNPSGKGESFAYIFVDDKFQLIYCTIDRESGKYENENDMCSAL